MIVLMLIQFHIRNGKYCIIKTIVGYVKTYCLNFINDDDVTLSLLLVILVIFYVFI